MAMSARIDESASKSTSQPAAFIVGCPRSGTTLLLRMLDSHPLIAVANDTHWVPRVLEKQRPRQLLSLLNGISVRLDPGLVESVVSYHRFWRMGLDEPAARAAAYGCGTYAEYVARLYSLFAESRGKTLALEKTPDYVRNIPMLHALCPSAKFIHLVRDGRDVALSLRDWATKTKGPGKLARWDDQPLGVAALWWQWLVLQGRTDGAQLPQGLYLEISYESLLADAPGVMRTICEFLAIPFEPGMLQFYLGRSRTDEGLSAKSAWLPPTQGLRSWRTQMNDMEMALCGRLAREGLRQFDYEASEGQLAEEIAPLADELQAWWDELLLQRKARFDARCRAAEQAEHEAGCYVI